MHFLLILLGAAGAAVCAVPDPPGAVASSPRPGLISPPPHRQPISRPRFQEYMGDYLYNRLMMPQFVGYEEEARSPVIVPDHLWLNKEIDRLNQMEEDEDGPTTYEVDVTRWISRDPVLRHMFDNAGVQELPTYERALSRLRPESLHASSSHTLPLTDNNNLYKKSEISIMDKKLSHDSKEKREKFALTPEDKGYFDKSNKEAKEIPIPNEANGMHEGGDPQAAMLIEPPRQIRQNPNLSKTKTLVAENLDRLRTGLKLKDLESYQIPVSLLPINLRWYNLDRAKDKTDGSGDKSESSLDDEHGTDKPGHVHILETAKDPADSMYGIAIIAALCAAVTMAIFGFAIGWYTLFKKAKAAADVDYPAYGVTGPTMESSGDRKLAHSAHMYHYQHQKQQIIAMERNGLEQRNGSISDPESEEENEEGDYTVYECPGFATTGDMEVRNPLFSEDPTLATPGKCEVVKPQPKD